MWKPVILLRGEKETSPEEKPAGGGSEPNLMRMCADLVGEAVIRLRCFCLPGDSSWSQGFPGSPPFPHSPCGHAHTCTHTWTHAKPADPSHPYPLSGAWSPVPLSLLQLSPTPDESSQTGQWPQSIYIPDTSTLMPEPDPWNMILTLPLLTWDLQGPSFT